MYEIKFSDKGNQLQSLPGIYEITALSGPDSSGVTTASIRLESDHSMNDVLKLIIDKIELRSMNEVIPAIHDIFISQVKLMGDE